MLTKATKIDPSLSSFASVPKSSDSRTREFADTDKIPLAAKGHSPDFRFSGAGETADWCWGNCERSLVVCASTYDTEMGLSLQEIDAVLDALCGAAEYRQVQSDWIPRLSDPDDEPLLQMAVEAKVPIIATRNVGHLKPAESFGIELLTPSQFLAKLSAGT